MNCRYKVGFCFSPYIKVGGSRDQPTKAAAKCIQNQAEKHYLRFLTKSYILTNIF
jgi:hypothetical protein